MSDLNDFIDPASGWRLLRALSINDEGTIAASATPAGSTATHGVLLVAADPAQMLARLESTVATLGLNEGSANSLAAKLDAAAESLEGGDTKTACNQLGAFVNEAEAQRGKKLTTAQANQLIDTAAKIRAKLGCK